MAMSVPAFQSISGKLFATSQEADLEDVRHRIDEEVPTLPGATVTMILDNAVKLAAILLPMASYATKPPLAPVETTPEPARTYPVVVDFTMYGGGGTGGCANPADLQPLAEENAG